MRNPPKLFFWICKYKLKGAKNKGEVGGVNQVHTMYSKAGGYKNSLQQ